MADLSTKLMGIELSSPVIVAASSFSKHVDKIKQAEDNGAGALVIKSLFEEQIQLEVQELEDALEVGGDTFHEAPSYFPDLSHAGPEEHLFWVEKARKAVSMPLIASLNAVSPGSWIDWAVRLQNAGVQALELNVFTLGSSIHESGADIEKRMLDVVSAVIAKVSIPVAVKLGPSLTAPGHVVAQLAARGVKSVVLFNRFFSPDIDPMTEKVVTQPHFSRPEEATLPLRWVGLLAGRVATELVASTGIHDAAGVIRQILAGAQACQVASALYTNGMAHIQTMNDGLRRFMDDKGYATLEDFRGKLSQKNLADPYAFERAQYIKLLLGFD